VLQALSALQARDCAGYQSVRKSAALSEDLIHGDAYLAHEQRVSQHPIIEV